MKKIFLTGGAGYIGSNLVIKLIEAGYTVFVYDNLSNSSRKTIEEIGIVLKLKNIDPSNFKFTEGDILDEEKLNEIFKANNFFAIVHLAGLKSVGDSVIEPLNYYSNNICGTIILLQTMKKNNIENLIFSSSASIYGPPDVLPIPENHRLMSTNPYAHSKLIVEKILFEYSSLSNLNIISLRYFNPVGANSTGYLMDNPKNPTNLMPLLMQAADPTLQKKLLIYGDDFETDDGTGVRDYIHIDDLVEGHLSAIQYLQNFSNINTNKGIFEAYNLGTGTGYSVLQMKEMVESIANTKIAYEIVGKRTGDVGSCYANVEMAMKNLKWKAKLGLKDMCKSSWNAYCKKFGG